MPQAQTHSPRVAVLGLRAFKGGAVVVAVTLAAGEPGVVLSTVLDTSAPDDRLSFEPYRLAAEAPRGPDGRATPEAVAIVAEGRRRQEQLATQGLQAIIHKLEAAGCRPVLTALLVNRAGWVTDLLGYSLAWDEHVPVAETLAVREALRVAARQCEIAMVELDEKSLPELAAKTLGLPATAQGARLKALGAAAGKPWRKEKKLACLSAWLALADGSAVDKAQPASSS